MPFRSWDWLATWWKYYGAPEIDLPRGKRMQLRVLAAFDSHSTQLVGIAPFYLSQTATRGRVLRWLGTGEVCTDHLSLVCRAEDAKPVAESMAAFLTEQDNAWDAIELAGVNEDDHATACFLQALQERSCDVSRRRAEAIWKVSLPETWDEYLGLQSKSHRKQLRRAERRLLEDGQIEWRTVGDPADFETVWDVLVELHQRRRNSLGEPGCFASQAFANYHCRLARRMLARGRLRLSWLKIGGVPVAAEYHFAGANTTFAYQGGVDPERLDDEPGRLSNIACIQAAIAEGHTTFDFLRGDEPYKTHWRAQPHSTYDYRAVPDRRLARLRGQAVRAAGNLVGWLKGD
jgi:CelD/BcsL family acetyltransferase involved in cellulose biosynthesis